MNDFKLKIVLAVLTGVVFSFIFILLAFVVPTKNKTVYHKKAVGKLEKVSESLRR
ncbi:hypothetical protein JHD48_02235 [Sulfurimonas sp. SAG-AH-194-I05]|nr:hypothetical protein [Sulfurimonas sp. SAG-AH-194-I05]MDF1874547.1 hypothetical protein [Sulfurimonas sp. SAG-AH-194-I05]